ncbi:uncharacterized protein LOC135094858 isoform X2 [Scylla paramamosain]|uniref:uncharacterized protein LOC135094858 isoform X2 n=1 Tax=Scylla paramamosain TaxID=85552 RepID=UPI0030829239
MDIEQLIDEVSHTPAIWDSSDTKHSDRVFIARQWKRIGGKLGVSDEAAKKKFKNLRDQFRLELKKVPEGRAGDPTLAAEEYLSSWPWFRLMFFIKDKITRRMTNNTMPAITIKRSNDEMEATEYEAYDENNYASQDDRLNSSFSDITRPSCPKRLRESIPHADYLAIESQRLELLKRQSDDERDSDRMFLLSLLPAIKTLEPRRSHLFRLKVHHLLYDARYSPHFEEQ